MRMISLMLVLFVPVIASSQSGGKCGEARWNVKVLRDADTSRVDHTAIPTTIGALLGLPAPTETRPSSGRLWLETRTFRVRALLVRRIDAEPDGDIHLILADPSDHSHQLVAEIPDASCAKGSRFASDFAEAQRITRSLADDLEVEVEGVAFWDDQHSQSGMAPNGIELHPVLRISAVYTRSDILREDVDPAARVDEGKEIRVWVNTSSKVYHCPGSTYYGNTARGQYMPLSAAERSGARPAGGKACR